MQHSSNTYEYKTQYINIYFNTQYVCVIKQSHYNYYPRVWKNRSITKPYIIKTFLAGPNIASRYVVLRLPPELGGKQGAGGRRDP